MAKQKFYVVWEGKEPGVYTTWEACKRVVDGFPGAKYKSFSTLAEAEYAFEGAYEEYKGKNTLQSNDLTQEQIEKIGKPVLNAVAVDAACSGNPGLMEYQGVDMQTGETLFKMGPFDESTNNVGEFLALVHAASLLKKNQDKRIIYSDSKIALGWVRQKKCKTKLVKRMANFESFALIERAEKWLQANVIENPLVKWETKVWGEIPADFGRK